MAMAMGMSMPMPMAKPMAMGVAMGMAMGMGICRAIDRIPATSALLSLWQGATTCPYTMNCTSTYAATAIVE
mgnify:CR=1 FL=1